MFESILFRLLVLPGSLSLSRTRSLKTPISYEVAYDKYRESLSCPHPPHARYNRVLAISQAGRYDDINNDHIAQHYPSSNLCFPEQLLEVHTCTIVCLVLWTLSP